MNKIQKRLIKQAFPVAVALLASLFSIVTLLGEFKSFVSYELLLGIVGSAVGVVVAYLFVRIKEATDAPRIFISYSHEDSEFAEKLYSELHLSSFNILMDSHEINVGDNIKDKIEELMINSDYLLFIGSEHSSKSKWSSLEIDKARKLKKKILPLMIDKSEVPEFIKDTMYADFSESFDDGMDALIRALKSTRHNKKSKADA